MSTAPELNEVGRRLVAEIKRITNDPDMTGAEKGEALDKIQPDFEAHIKSVSDSESASEANNRAEAMAKKLGGDHADVKDVKSGASISRVRTDSPWAARGADLALEAIESADAEKYLYKSLNSKQKYDFGIELGLKDSTASGNLMGDFIYGNSGPTAIGQNPFGSTGAFAQGLIPTFLPGIVEKLFYELTLSDLISEFPVTTPNISYLTEAVANFQANATAESGTYPFSSEEVARAYAQVGKVANAMTISDEAVQDAPTLWNFVQGRLLQGVQRREEVEILAGAGLPGVGGLLSTFNGQFTASSANSLFGATTATNSVTFPPAGTNGSGVQPATIGSLKYGRVITGGTGVFPTAVSIAENLADAFVDIQLQVFQTPNAIVMHPRDWLTLRIAKDNQGQYFNSSFFGQEYGNAHGVVKSLWGVPVVTTPLMPQHTFLTGWFDSSTVQVARRKGVTMQMTNTNGTDFVQGNITARAESRLGLLCYRPSAFQLVSCISG